ncbi:Hypothetical predicted protein [Xyrichtys novacula]|uniref:Uncharacterized protein n=1 Tax=Xyrichtys novacula TaxID=13765 RepID=A0AAV1G433_XYRNO|nr:Hypothetical predicted protein [Xyrichtys novacula]
MAIQHVSLQMLPLGCQQSPVFMRGHLTRASAPFVSVGPNMRVNGEKTLTLSPALRGPQTRRGTAEQLCFVPVWVIATTKQMQKQSGTVVRF